MTKNFRTAFAALALVAAAGLTACNDNKAADTSTAKVEASASAPINKNCPFSGEACDGKTTSAYQGKTVAFCCAGCKGKFDKMDATHQAAMVAKAQ